MKIIFLDIDGVLQPDTQKRFSHNLDELKQKFSAQNKEFNRDFPSKFVQTRRAFNAENYAKAVKILGGK